MHADIGGGYAEPESGLAKVTLRWMIDEARATGLLFSESTARRLIPDRTTGKYYPPDAKTLRHDQRGTWGWRHTDGPLRFALAKGDRVDLSPKGLARHIPEKSLLHQSIFDHAAANAYGALPVNFPNQYDVIA